MLLGRRFLSQVTVLGEEFFDTLPCGTHDIIDMTSLTVTFEVTIYVSKTMGFCLKCDLSVQTACFGYMQFEKRMLDLRST